MGRDPLVLTVSGWRLEVDMKDRGLQICIVTDDDPPRTHFVRLTQTQSGVMRDYLDDVVPVTQ